MNQEEEHQCQRGLVALRREMEEQLRNYERLLGSPIEPPMRNRGLQDRRPSAPSRPFGLAREDAIQPMYASLPLTPGQRTFGQNASVQPGIGRGAFAEDGSGTNQCTPFQFLQRRVFPIRNRILEEEMRNAESPYGRGNISSSTPRQGNVLALQEGQRQRATPGFSFFDQLRERQAIPSEASAVTPGPAHHSPLVRCPPNDNLEGGSLVPQTPQAHQAQVPQSSRAQRARIPLTPYVHQSQIPQTPYSDQSQIPQTPHVHQSQIPQTQVHQAQIHETPHVHQAQIHQTPQAPQAQVPQSPHVHQAQVQEAQAQSQAQAPLQRESPRAPRVGSEMHDHHHQHHHHHHRHLEGPLEPVERDEKAVSALRHLTQLTKTPSYSNCELERGLEFLEVCDPSSQERPKVSFLERPELEQDDIDNFVRCEKQDVESVLYLVSDDRKTYKKPCPKQQKAQKNVKAIVQSHTSQICGTDYSPLEHPDPDDISPDFAAAMVFCQEKGIELEGCPKYAIDYLFPEEQKIPFPEKLPPDNVSVVDPDQKQQEEMIEQSAQVPAEGVSDSAYSKKKKKKKEKAEEELQSQKSYDVDFAVCQTKREYVLVTHKPDRINIGQFRGGGSPPWFPGYYSAFPDEDGGLKLVASPSKLFEKAWTLTKPTHIPTSDVIVLD